MNTDSATIVRADTYASIPWFQVSRKLAQDSRLSFDHRGLMMYLLSKPANWRVNHQDIMREGGIGRDKTIRLVKELQEFGYMEYVVERDTKGSFAGGYYRVYDLPELMPEPGPLKTRSPGEPESGKTDTYSRESNRVKENDDYASVFSYLDTNGVVLTSIISDRYKDLVSEYGVDAVLGGMRRANEKGKLGAYAYVLKCIKTENEKPRKKKVAFTQEEQDFLKEMGW